MENKSTEKGSGGNTNARAARAGCAVLIVLLSIAIAAALVLTRPSPPRDLPGEPVLAVRMLTASVTNAVVRIEGYGEARPLREINLSAQVGGRVLNMPRRLRAGDLVEEGEPLLRIESEEYEATLEEARAAADRLEATLEQFDVREASEKNQLALAERSLELARGEFERLRRLAEEGRAVSDSAVDAAEQVVTRYATTVEQLRQSLALIPGLRTETRSELRAAKARVRRAALNLERCRVTAPFDGRIVRIQVEEGSVVQPGQTLLRLADDSVLEIPVPVTATDLRSWVPFETPVDAGRGWFPPLPGLPVEVAWSEGGGEYVWEGAMDRISRFDATTRTAEIVVRVAGGAVRSGERGLPLTAGMFCRVALPGRGIEGVIRLPRSAVTFDGKAYVSEAGRLKTVDVDVLRSEDTHVYVGGGIVAGDQVVATRLIAPLEGARLEPVED